jgi:Transglutaminase-like superfamily
MPELYVLQDALTNPGALRALFAGLPESPSALRELVSGLIVHVARAASYGIQPDTPMPRETLPVAERLALTQSALRAPLTTPRSPAQRTFGTCRDYALMLTAMLRQRAIPARVRCGFATYFTSAPYEDHWICEYWSAAQARWVRVDAQIDERLRDQLAITFDCADLPQDVFLPAGQAWQLARSGNIDADASGHGNDRGWWFLRVNVHRDLLALTNQATSAWDSWRSSTVASKQLTPSAFAAVDRMADASAAVDRSDQIGILQQLAAANQTPPWQA